jgi:hypothetical protein
MKHPLFEVLGGHPLSICIIAPQLMNKTLKQLFESIVSSSLFILSDGRLKEDTLI